MYFPFNAMPHKQEQSLKTYSPDDTRGICYAGLYFFVAFLNDPQYLSTSWLLREMEKLSELQTLLCLE